MASRPVFIVGAARSGTNLVRALLSAHPSIELRGEPELFLSLLRAGIAPDDVVPRAERVRLLFELSHTGLTRQHIAALPPDTIETFLTDRRELGFRGVYELLLPRPADGLVWGEKSLGNAYLIDEIASIYPDALFVHVVRDPRATTWSWVSLHYLEDEGEELELEGGAVGAVAYSAMRWANWTDAIDRATERLPEHMVARIRFEELVEDPQPVLTRICGLVDVEFDAEMLDPERRQDDPVLEGRRRAHGRLSEPVDPGRAAAGDELPFWAAAVVERHAEQGMARHGYPRRGEALAAGEREELDRELDFIEPILRERLARDQARTGRPDRAMAPDEAEGASAKPESLAGLAATAIRRRGIGAESETEVEALRAFAAAALAELEEARSARLRAKRRRAADAKRKSPAGDRKKRSKRERRRGKRGRRQEGAER